MVAHVAVLAKPVNAARVGRRLDHRSLVWLLDALQAMAQPAVYPLAA